MVKRTLSLTLVLVVTVALTWAPQTEAYEFYNADGGNACVQCHPGFDGFGETLHDFHNGFVPSCSDCHGQTGDNPRIDKCAACHIPNPLWNAHRSAPVAQMGIRCSTCHSFVANDVFSWGETKDLFK